jgi:hypothetical protein
VRLTQAPLADNYNRAALIWSDRFDTFQEVMSWVSDLKKFGRCDLCRTGIAFIGKLDRSAFEALAFEFLA